MCGIAKRARDKELDVAVYMIGDGVLCAKKDQKGFIGENMKMALKNGVTIKASKNDLFARAVPEDQVEPGVQLIDDLEGIFVEDVMENADRVITW